MHPLVNLAVAEGNVAIHWFEQASFAIKDAQGTVVLVDPYFPHERPLEKFIHSTPPLDEAELPAQYVLLTHAHSDHTHPETLRRIAQASPQAVFVGPAESIRLVVEASINRAQTVTVQAGDVVSLGTMTAHAVYAKPPQGDPMANIPPPDVTHLGYVVETGGGNLYFSGDPIHTFPEHDDLVQAVAAHRPDLGFLTNHPTEGEFPFFDGCVKMAQRVGLKHVAPSHYACFVRRNYDPYEWAAQFPPGGPVPLIIPRNSHILYPGHLRGFTGTWR